MSNITIGLLSFPALLFLIFLRVPIGLAMFLAGLVGLTIVSGDTTLAFAPLKSETFTTFLSYSLSIIPMFLLMGAFAALGGMSQALFKAAESFLGHRKGGGVMAAVGACAGSGAICGSSLATAATMSRVALTRAAQIWLFGWLLDSHPRGEGYAWHSDPVLNRIGNLCDPDRAKHCQIFPCGIHSRSFGPSCRSLISALSAWLICNPRVWMG